MVDNSSYQIKKYKLLKLVVVLTIGYSMGLAFMDFFGISEKIEYRTPLMVLFAISNGIILYILNKKRYFDKTLLLIVLIIALTVFTITMVIYPQSEIRVMWYFFTIMIAYFIGGTKIGNITAISSILILIVITQLYLEFPNSVVFYFIIGILFMSQLSNYFVKILNENEKDLYKYQNHLKDMVKDGLKEIEELNKEITDTQKEVVFTMGSIAESRSKETGNHVKRVAKYSVLLAKEYGLPKEQVKLIELASPMHDMGKIAIPDNILNKPARFTDKEFDIMKGHAFLGFDMLKHSKRPILHTAAIIAHQHHERWDGAGYPQGLKGEQIDISARITSIADVFDALGSDRCYKKAWDDEKIFKLFKEESSKQFDPKLIEIFFNNLDEILQIRDELSDIK